MDRTTIMLQNKQLIEELINSSDETKVKVHAAIIDGVSKRIVKNVIANMDDSIKMAIEDAQDALSKKFMDIKSNNGWGKYYKLKPEYEEEVRKSVHDAWSDEIYKSVQEWKSDIEERYRHRLEAALNGYINKIDYLTAHLEDKIKDAVDANISRRLGGE